MSSLKRAPILILPAPGMTNAARKTATNVPGPSTFLWSHSATEPSGRFRVSGPTTHITLEPATQTAPAKKDASTATEIYHRHKGLRRMMLVFESRYRTIRRFLLLLEGCEVTRGKHPFKEFLRDPSCPSGS